MQTSCVLTFGPKWPKPDGQFNRVPVVYTVWWALLMRCGAFGDQQQFVGLYRVSTGKCPGGCFRKAYGRFAVV